MDGFSNKQVKGTPVISISDGAKLGLINAIYVDPTQKRIAGFSIDPGSGLLAPDSTKVIDVEDVHSLGPDALTLDGQQSIRGERVNRDYGNLVEIDELMKLQVVTEGGQQVGQIASILFDPKTFRLTGIEASPGFFKSNKTIPMSQVTTIGPELIVVSNAVCAPEGEPAGESEGRFWKSEIPAEYSADQARTTGT